MRILLEEDLAGCGSLEAVQRQTEQTLGDLQRDGYAVHYVAGPISCDGEAHIPDNLRRLVEARTAAMHLLGERVLLFTAPFIFTADVYQRLGIFSMPRRHREEQLQRFWDKLITSGAIDAVHFVPGWQRSPGARRERLTAVRSGVAVYDL